MSNVQITKWRKNAKKNPALIREEVQPDLQTVRSRPLTPSPGRLRAV